MPTSLWKKVLKRRHSIHYASVSAPDCTTIYEEDPCLEGGRRRLSSASELEKRSMHFLGRRRSSVVDGDLSSTGAEESEEDGEDRLVNNQWL